MVEVKVMGTEGGEGVRTWLVVGGRGRRQDEQTDGTQQHIQSVGKTQEERQQ